MFYKNITPRNYGFLNEKIKQDRTNELAIIVIYLLMAKLLQFPLSRDQNLTLQNIGRQA